MRICDLTDFRTRQCVKSVFLFGVPMNKPLFTFFTSIGITVQVVTEINDVPLRGLFILEIDPDCIVNDKPISVSDIMSSPDGAEAKAMRICHEIEMMALELARPVTFYNDSNPDIGDPWQDETQRINDKRPGDTWSEEDMGLREL